MASEVFRLIARTAFCLLIFLAVLKIAVGTSTVLDLALFVGSCVLFLSAISLRIDRYVWLNVMPWFGLLFIYGAWVLITPTVSSVKHLVTTGMAVFILISTISLSNILCTSLVVRGAVFVFAAIVFVLAMTNYGAQKNNLSGALLYFSMLTVAMVPRYFNFFGVIVAAAVSLFASLFVDHRAGIALAALSVGLYLLLRIITLRRAGLMLGLSAGLAAIFVFTITLSGHGFISLEELNRLAVEVTGRRATSGREMIWSLVLNSLSGHFGVGLGGGTLFADLYDNGWSAHSLYMQVLLQCGLVGLGMIIGGLFGVANLFSVNQTRRWGVFHASGVSVLALIVVHSATEVFLTQNLLAIGIPAMSALGLFVGRSLKESG